MRAQCNRDYEISSVFRANNHDVGELAAGETLADMASIEHEHAAVERTAEVAATMRNRAQILEQRAKQDEAAAAAVAEPTQA